ncbi:hypothetical protein, partial [Delftia acidovorans]|uniref:hypothetical protein n=1 Tax=Delftia acidovorans TaxID=80866 RepID=UPI00359F3BFB
LRGKVYCSRPVRLGVWTTRFSPIGLYLKIGMKSAGNALGATFSCVLDRFGDAGLRLQGPVFGFAVHFYCVRWHFGWPSMLSAPMLL